jgi:hypothetical protein
VHREARAHWGSYGRDERGWERLARENDEPMTERPHDQVRTLRIKDSPISSLSPSSFPPPSCPNPLFLLAVLSFEPLEPFLLCLLLIVTNDGLELSFGFLVSSEPGRFLPG